jgi:hypothetical protein
MADVRQISILALHAVVLCCVMATLCVCAPSTSASALLSHSNCHRFDVNLGYIEGSDLNYRFYDVEVHAAPCKAAQRVISGYLHGHGHPLGGDHGPTELRVDGWDVILVDLHANGGRGSKWFRARYTL